MRDSITEAEAMDNNFSPLDFIHWTKLNSYAGDPSLVERKARKDHICDSCRRAIRSGSLYYDYNTRETGHIRFHIGCE